LLAANVSHWPAADMLVEVTARPFLVQERHPFIEVEVHVNGSMLERWSYHYARDNGFVTRSARVPASLLAASSVLELEFRISQPANPKMLGAHSTDDRDLGLFVSRASFSAAWSEGDVQTTSGMPPRPQ
jgi:hypothetical protein